MTAADPFSTSKAQRLLRPVPGSARHRPQRRRRRDRLDHRRQRRGQILVSQGARPAGRSYRGTTRFDGQDLAQFVDAGDRRGGRRAGSGRTQAVSFADGSREPAHRLGARTARRHRPAKVYKWFPVLADAPTSRRACCRAGSSRWWRWGGRCSPIRACCCATRSASGSPR